MRGGEAIGAHSAGGQQALGHAGRGGLAVGTGDVDGAVGALRVAQDVENSLNALQGGLDLVLRCTGEDLGLNLAHAGGDLDGAGSSLQIPQVLVLGDVGELRLPGLPVIGVVSVNLGEELLEAVGIATGDHVGGDELAQGLKVLAILSLSVRLLLGARLLEVRDGDGQTLCVRKVRGAHSLQVGQQLGVDPAPTEDGVDDLLPRGTLGNAKGGTRRGLLGVVTCGHCAILYSTRRTGWARSQAPLAGPNLAETATPTRTGDSHRPSEYRPCGLPPTPARQHIDAPAMILKVIL